jgi:HAD superfamily hydrolase (TIGR01509 family)
MGESDLNIDFRKFEAVIFDLDGTLVDSMWMWHKIDMEFLAKHGFEVPEDFNKEIEGCSFTETAEYFIRRFGLKMGIDELKEEWFDMAGHYYCSEVKTKPGVVDFLDHLKGLGMKLGIATSNESGLTRKTLEANGILGYFDAIKTSCEVEKGKPYPFVYLAAASDLGVEPSKCIAVEDTEAGLDAGLAAGMTVISIYDESSEKYHEDIKARSHYFIDSFEELEF